jgi:hypothetical protein
MKRYRGANLRHGLVGAWAPSVAGNGLLLPDLSGYGNHGTLTNMDASDWVGTDRGRALDFDGVDDYVDFGTRLLTEATFSVSAWFRSGGDNGIIVAKSRNVSAVNRWWIAVNQNPSTGGDQAGNLYIAGTNSVGSGVTAAASVGANDNRWHQVVGVWQNTSMYLFFDGTNVASNLSIRANQLSQFNLLIGKYNDSSGGATGNTGNLQGQLDDIRIYNRALSPSEIKQLYEGGPGYGLRQERKRSRFQVQGFSAGRYRRQQLIGSGVY